MNTPQSVLDDLIKRYASLAGTEKSVYEAFEAISKSFEKNGKLLLAGNGGSCADCDHITGELLKGFKLPRMLSEADKKIIQAADNTKGRLIADKLQYGLPAINLCANAALSTAVANDTDPLMIFAQQVYAYGAHNDVLFCISPIGKAQNLLYAVTVAKSKGMTVISMTGDSGGMLLPVSDICIRVPTAEVFAAQELHLPIYHCLCMMLENHFFSKNI